MLKCLFLHVSSWIVTCSRPTRAKLFDNFYVLVKHGSIFDSGKLPIYPSPNTTFCPKWEVNVTVGLGRGGWRVSKNPILVFVVYKSFCKTLVSLYVANKCSCETCLYTRLVTWELSDNQSWRLVPSPCRPESTSFQAFGLENGTMEAWGQVWFSMSYGWFPLTRFWLRTLTHVNFNHVNKIEAR